MQAKKASNESDDTFLQRFNIFKTQIGDEANDPAKIEVMLFFAGLDEPMQRKIREQSSMPETKHDLVALAKKLRPNLDREPKPSLPTRTRPTSSTSAQPNLNDTVAASSLHEDGRRKEVFCSYYKRKDHKEAQCRKKSRDAKQRKETRPNTAGAKIATVNESGLGHRQAKQINLACRQSLIVVLFGQTIQTLVDTASDLILIRKDIADHLRLQPLFPARPETQAGYILRKTYLVFHERLRITNSFGTHPHVRDSLTSANIKIPLILGLPWLQHHNLILNLDLMTIKWRDSSSSVTDSVEKLLDFGSLTQIPTNFQVMQVQLETLDESLEEPTILKEYRDLANVFSPFNTNFLPPHQDKDHVIELQPGKKTSVRSTLQPI